MTRRLPSPIELRIPAVDQTKIGQRRVFKYVHRKNLQSILNRGSIKVGWLSEYRTIENVSLRDEREGIVSSQAAGPISIHDFHLSHHARTIAQADKDSNIIFAGTILRRMSNFPVFCFSYVNASDAYQSLSGNDEPYDAVIEISNIRTFAREVARVLSTIVHPNVGYFYLPVIYTDREPESHEASPSPFATAFFKRTCYRDNAEGRIVFSPSIDWQGFGEVVSPLRILEVPAICSLLREVPLPV